MTNGHNVGRKPMPLGPAALARASGSRPWRTVLIWVLVLAGAVLLSSQLLGGALTTSSDSVDRPESARATELIEELRGRSTDTEFVLITTETATVDDSGYMAYVSHVQDALKASQAAMSVGSYLTGDGPVSETGRTALLPVVVAGQDPGEISANVEVIKETVSGIEPPYGYQALLAGPATLNNDFDRIAEEDLATGETSGSVWHSWF